MKKRPLSVIFGFLLIGLSFSAFASAYVVGDDYPDYEIYHGKWILTSDQQLIQLFCKSITPCYIWNEIDTIKSNKIPVILVPGISNIANVNDSYKNEWGNLQFELEKAGFDIWRLQYYPANLSVKKSAGVLSKAIGDVLNKGYTTKQVFIVSYDSGGLISRAYIAGLGVDDKGISLKYNKDISKLVMISSPLYGTYLANLFDNSGRTDLNLHPDCLNLFSGSGIDIYSIDKDNLLGKTEVMNDLEIGSDLTWELNSHNFPGDIDYLTILGKKTLGDFNDLDVNQMYCMGNNEEKNDGFTSLINGALLSERDGVPIVVFNLFHNDVEGYGNGISKDSNVGKLTSRFLNNTPTYNAFYINTIMPLLKTSQGEFYFNRAKEEGSLSGESELTTKGGLILDIKSSEDLIKEGSLLLRKKVSKYSQVYYYYNMEVNRNTKRAFILINQTIPGAQLGYTTTLEKGNDYELVINGIFYSKYSGNMIEIKEGEVDLISLILDEDGDGFDTDKAGGRDCADSDSLINPDIPDYCNGMDENCNPYDDGINEEWYGTEIYCGVGECRRAFVLNCTDGYQDNESCVAGTPALTGDENKDYDCDGLIGKIEDANPNLILSYVFIDPLLIVKENGKPLFEFRFDMNTESLDIRNMSIFKQGANDSYGYVIINGLDLESHNKTKVVYMDKILAGTGICIEDKIIMTLSEISEGCNGEGEVWMKCDGSTAGGYTCEMAENNSMYKISGLKHSAIKEIATFCGDGACNGAESCSSCSGDCGVCVSTSSSGGGGGGGGGGRIIKKNQSSVTLKNTTISEIKEAEPEDSVTADVEVVGDNEESDNSDNSRAAHLTGAVVGTNRLFRGVMMVLALFVLIISGSWIGLNIYRANKGQEHGHGYQPFFVSHHHKLITSPDVKHITHQSNLTHTPAKLEKQGVSVRDLAVGHHKCKHCGTVNSSWRKFCQRCGRVPK